jgi:putative phosphoribosyl transferase
MTMVDELSEHLVRIRADSVTLEGMLSIPAGARSVVLFAHGSGSSRHSPRNNYVAAILRGGGIGTLLFDLLTEEEDAVHETRFDIHLLTSRLTAATQWLAGEPKCKKFAMGYFGASTGAAAALEAASDLGSAIGAVVSRGGRPDLAGPVLDRVGAPTLLMVGGSDEVVIELNRQAYDRIRAEKELIIIPRATHLFEEPGALEEVARRALGWFTKYLGSNRSE